MSANFWKVPPSIWWVYSESFYTRFGESVRYRYCPTIKCHGHAAVSVNFVTGLAGFWYDNIQNVWLVMSWDGELWVILTYIHLANPNAVTVFDTSIVPAATKVMILLLMKINRCQKKMFYFWFLGLSCYNDYVTSQEKMSHQYFLCNTVVIFTDDDKLKYENECTDTFR